jgi:hypothetical protein
MSGALINLVSKGVQDAFITGDPQVSFFRQNYKRHTNFAMKPVEINGIGVNAPGAQLTFKVENMGDLLTGVWLDLGPEGDVGAYDSAVVPPQPADDMIITNPERVPTRVELWVGGKMIDSQDAFYGGILYPSFLAPTHAKTWLPESAITSGGGNNYYPLHFFHCDNATTPLPLVALQYQEVEIRVIQSPHVGASYANINHKIRMFAEYVQLDTTERQWFTEQPHDMLITQVQRIQAGGSGSDLIYLNHPVKTLMWGLYGNDTTDIQLYVNGTQYFNTPMNRNYFTCISSYYHSPNSEYAAKGGGGGDLFGGMAMFPFALDVSSHQPTGTLNFSRVDNSKLTWEATEDPLSLYAVNYNIFRIESGLGGVRFSN